MLENTPPSTSSLLQTRTPLRHLFSKHPEQTCGAEPEERELNLNETFEMHQYDIATVPEAFHCQKLTLGLGWSTAGQEDLDLDASCLFLDENYECSEKWTLSSNDKKLPGAVHLGDTHTGDAQQIHVVLNEVPINMHHLVFVLNIHSEYQTFSEVCNSYIRMVDENNHVMARFKLDGSITSPGVFFAVLSRKARQGWTFKAMGGAVDHESARECFEDVKSLMLGQSTATRSLARKSQNKHQVRPRMNLVNQLVEKCRIGNPNIDSSNVVLVSREDFLEMGKITKYEDCSDRHLKVQELTRESHILFVSHRWQDVDSNKPDDQINIQYLLIVSFLESTAGADITHIWVDYSCITQDKVTSLGMFRKQLDNIQTAIFLADVVLVIPRVVYEAIGQSCCLVRNRFAPTRAQWKLDYGYTDLLEINDRGWCLFEAITAEVALCEIHVAFLAGSLATAKFFEVQGGTPPGSALSLASLQEEVSTESFTTHRSYKLAVKNAVSSIWAEDGCVRGLGKRAAFQNWKRARDPLQLWKTLQAEARKSNFEKSAVSLTLRIYSGSGERIAALLPHFSYDSDRSIVTNLMANVAGFVCGRFEDIQLKTELEISTLTAKCTDDWDLDWGSQALLPADLETILRRKDGLSEGYRLNLDNNYVGYNGANVLVRGGFLQKITNLRFSRNGLGTAGAFALGESLKMPTNALMILDLDLNEIGDVGAQALADGLRQNATLTELYLEGNQIGVAGAQALADGLRHNATLTKFHLGYNAIKISGALALAEVLKHNTTLSTLDLESNQIGDAGAQALADGLRHNATLTELNLEGNRIRDAGAQALADGLCHNTTLTKFNVDFSLICEGEKALVKAWKSTHNGSTEGLSRDFLH